MGSNAVTLDMSTAQPIQAAPPVKLDMSTATPIGQPAAPNYKSGQDKRGSYTTPVDAASEAADMLGESVKSLAKISGPNTVYEMLRTHFPQLGLKPGLGMPTPGEVVVGGAGMVAGGEDVTPSEGAAAPRVAPKEAPGAASSAASILDHPGIAPWVGALRRELMKIPGMDFAKTAVESAKGFAEGAPKAGEPIPVTNGVPWGTKIPQQGPPELWGQEIPQPAAAAQPVAAASPVPVAAAAKTFSGEGQLRELLSTQTNRGLLKIAKARGVDVSAEADLKSAIANPRLINKIIDNFSDGELDAVRTQAPIQAAQEATTAAPASAAPTPAATKAPYSGADRPRVLPSVQNIRETNAQVQAAQAAPNRPTPDSLDDRAMQQEMNWDLERHGWTADAEARREFIAKNSTGVTKSELTGAQEAPVRYTKTPGVPSWRGKPASGAPLATPGEDLLPKLQQMLDAAKKAKPQQ